MNNASAIDNPPATRLPRYRRASAPPPIQIVERDIAVLRWVHEMRFLTREQVQRLEFAPTTGSYCKRRLSLLYHHGYLERKFIPAQGSFGSTRAIYCLAAKGARLVAHELKTDLASLDWRPKDNDRELYFLRHTLAINDFRISVTLASQHHALALNWTSDRVLRRRQVRDYVPDPKHEAEKLVIVPDGYFKLRHKWEEMAFALETDRATVEEKPFKAKVRAYGEWKLSGAYQKRHATPSLRVLFVVDANKRDPHRLERIKRWAEAEGGRSLFWFAMLDDISPQTIMKAPVWQVAGRDGRYPLLTGGETWSGGTPQPDTSSLSPSGFAPG